MVLIDTSIWISLFRKRSEVIGDLMWSLTAKNEAAICGQILVEYRGGFRDTKRRQEFGDPFFEFPFLETNRDAFHLASDLLADYPKLGSGDAIIAATAIDHQVPLLTLDQDFKLLKKVGLKIFLPRSLTTNRY